jgi:hypothetical protein
MSLRRARASRRWGEHRGATGGSCRGGWVCVSRVVRDQVRDKLDYAFEDMGEQQVKNISRPVRVYRVRDAVAVKSATAQPQPALPLPEKPSIAVLPI